MGERRVMELLLQFIMGGESIVGQSEAQHYSCGRKGGQGVQGREHHVLVCAPSPDTGAFCRSP